MSYSPTLGRFLERDPIGYDDGMNVYQYVSSNPLKFVDPMGTDGWIDIHQGPVWNPQPPTGTTPPVPPPFGRVDGRDRRDNGRPAEGGLMDSKGYELFDHWLSGYGGDLTLGNGSWASYMKANTLLPPQLRDPILSDAYSRLKSGTFSRTFHAEIENGYFTGYEMLHGTNVNVGDFHMEGPATVTCNADGSRTIQYSITYTWNDIIDPNPQYREDTWSSNLLHWFFNPKDYTVHIKWKSDVEVKIKPNGTHEAKGYPFDK